jgi:hypothetical protein
LIPCSPSGGPPAMTPPYLVFSDILDTPLSQWFAERFAALSR